MRRRAQQ